MNPTVPKLLSVKQIQEVTGWSIATIYRYIDAGRLPVVKVVGRLQVKEEDLCKLIQSSTQRRGTLKRNWRIG